MMLRIDHGLLRSTKNHSISISTLSSVQFCFTLTHTQQKLTEKKKFQGKFTRFVPSFLHFILKHWQIKTIFPSQPLREKYLEKRKQGLKWCNAMHH